MIVSRFHSAFLRRFLAAPLGLALLLSWLGGAGAAGAAPNQRDAAGGSLRIYDVLFEDYEGWPTAKLELNAGQEVVLSFRVEGAERRAGRNEAGLPEYQVALRYQIEFLDPNGVLVTAPQQDEINQMLGPQDDQWHPLVRWSAAVPAWAPSGSYRIVIRVQDVIGGQDAEAKTSLHIRGEAVPAADVLQVSRLEFARAAEGPWSSTRFFALRDPIYVRFRVVGFRISEDNRVWVEQDWTVRDAEGRVLIHRENAVADRLQEFYPPRFLSTNFRVELDNPQPGAYTLEIALRDRIGEQTYRYEAPFTLRP